MANHKNIILSLGLVFLANPLGAQSLWERRDPNTTFLFQDFQARKIGDLLTIVVNETTEFDAQEIREMNKETKTGATFKFSGKTASDAVGRNFAADFDGSGNSQRKFDGRNNSSIDRKFLDRMTVTVVGVLPNGNLVVEGYRQRLVTREMRTLRVSGVVRPVDIGAGNIVQSSFIADFDVNYSGRGPESSYTNQGWMGRVMNKVWPY